MQELGEEVFPEPVAASAGATGQTKTVDSQEPPSNEPSPALDPSSPSTSASSTSDSQTERKVVTTIERKPLDVPDTVHVRITPETLKDYVGPPVYQKDRLYVNPPPAGVSTGLGYLGNGSGAVMPVEAMVRIQPTPSPPTITIIFSCRACQAKAASN